MRQRTWFEEAQEVSEAGLGAVGPHVYAVEAPHHGQGGVPEDAAAQEGEGQVCQAPPLLHIRHPRLRILHHLLPDLRADDLD